MSVQLYIDYISQPSRAVLCLCILARIPHEVIALRIFKGDLLTDAFKEINPDQKVPALVDGKFSLFESHAILRYLCNSRNVADHFYPKIDYRQRAIVDAYLDWHHQNTRLYCGTLVLQTNMPEYVKNKIEMNTLVKFVINTFNFFENFWLKEHKFIGGLNDISIADLSAYCEIIQLILMDYNFSKFPNICEWMGKMSKIKGVQDVHQTIFKIKQRKKQQKL